MTFEAWMTNVDALCLRRAGLSIYDLADQGFRDWFDDGVTANMAVALTLEGEGF